jgi:prepilin-type N-terminal cleavage/methylation domain-containing protein
MHDKGFTLIESLVTISILCIVLASALLIIDLDMFYLDKMADEFAMDVRYVQMECMKGAIYTHKIYIDIPNRSYHIFKDVAIRKTVVFKSRYQIEYSNQNMESVGFTQEGTPINPGTFTILDTRTNKTKKISIVPSTGRTVIKE